MARAGSVSRWVALLLSAAASAQTTGSTSYTSDPPSSTITSAPSSTTVSASSITSGTDASSSSDVPLSLWGIANSLLTSYYPSTSLTAINTLTWPSAVVVGSSTYSVHPGATGSPTTTSVLAEQTGSPTTSKSSSKGLSSDKKLGIILGVAIGIVALAILGLVFWCLSRRKKSTGSFFLRRPTPSITDSDIGDWRSPQRFEPASSRLSNDWLDSYNRLPQQAAPPMAMHPAYVRQHSSRSTSEDNPFFTPQERSDAQLGHYELDGTGAGMLHKEVDTGEESHRRSSSSVRRQSRPPTPFSPMLMMGGGLQQPQKKHNPFSSPEDDEADDIVSPIIPARSPERRHSPMVHYPSWSEVSEFDFSGQGRGHSVRGQPSSEEGGDGWHPARDSVVGRQELA